MAISLPAIPPCNLAIGSLLKAFNSTLILAAAFDPKIHLFAKSAFPCNTLVSSFPDVRSR